MEMKLFDNWKDIPTIHLDLMDRKIFTGKNVMLVRNEVHPKTTMPAHSHRHEQLLYVESGACDVITDGQVRRCLVSVECGTQRRQYGRRTPRRFRYFHADSRRFPEIRTTYKKDGTAGNRGTVFAFGIR